MTTKDMKDLLTMLEALRLAVLDEPSQSDQMAARVFPRSSVPPANFPDILLDEDARAKVLDAIEGQPVTELGDALLNADISLTFQINGDSVIAAAFSGTLAKSLSEAGHIHVHAGVVHAACPGSGRATVQGSTRRMARSFWPL